MLAKHQAVKHRLAKKIGCQPNEASDMIKLFAETIKEFLSEGKSVAIPGMGRFTIRDRKGYHMKKSIKGVEGYYQPPTKAIAFKRASTFTFNSLNNL